MRKYILLLLLLSIFIKVNATHQRAAEIIYKHVGGLTYEFTLISYTYTPSPTNQDRDDLDINWGDGAIGTIPRVEIIEMADEISYNKYLTTHTFPGPGTYTISMEDPNRNNGIVNIPNSVNIPMFIETQLTINPFLGYNNSVILTNAPVDMGCVDKLFIHNPGAYDPDGDSLSFHLVDCKGAEGLVIPGFDLPKASKYFTIDPVTGDIIWDAPVIQGEYNIAFQVKEWRNQTLIGSVVRDMQIEILACDNNPPVVELENDTCVVSGDLLELNFAASDPDGDELTLEAFGGPFILSHDPAFIDPNPAVGQTNVSTNFYWSTSCEHIRKAPYHITLKAKDKSKPISLVGYQTFTINVVSPPIDNLQVKVNERKAQLSWDAFPCNNINGYRIYRKNESYEWTADYCETGLPDDANYTLIGSTDHVDKNTFEDDDGGKGLLYGIKYCYRVCAILPDNSDGKVSEEFCIQLQKEVPILTHVSNELPNPEEGKLLVKWSKPNEINEENFPPPYFYQLYRKKPDETFEPIANNIPFNDTIYEDQEVNVNAIDKTIIYELEFYSESTGLIGISDPASSSIPVLDPKDESIIVNIGGTIPWHIDSIEVYRKDPHSSAFLLAGKTHGGKYIDKQLENGEEYAYYIKSFGHYDLNSIEPVLINYSSIAKATPQDNEPPCPVTVEITTDCKEVDNTLIWNTPKGDCPKDIHHYEIWYAPTSSAEFSEIGVNTGINDTVFIHENIKDVVGCYQVYAVDSVGNISDASATACVSVETCPVYELPNYFTPNGDGENDIYYPINYDSSNPRATVEEVNMRIFNRWGRIIFETSDPIIAWDGKDKNSNNDASTGVYYYTCEVFLQTLEGRTSYILKGSITIFR